MKKPKTEAKINLETLAGGAFAEKLNEALVQVADNIQNPNTEATTKRQINVTIKFAPNKTRQLVNTQIAVTTKLAATEAIDTQMIMGVNMRTGQLEIAEYDGQIRGQMSLSDLTQPQEKAEAAAGDTQQAKAAEPAAGTKEQEAAEPQPTGKPLDLKNRNKQQPQEKAEAAAGELIPGKDFDPETGEVLNDGQPVGEQKKIVVLGQRAAQA
ncbi:replication protein [uncultured Alistipes sp.]|uniref:replication protein n=1 Tax=uncultured Alistipes sp. TaxID=538949 RepID=UPI0032209785